MRSIPETIFALRLKFTNCARTPSYLDEKSRTWRTGEHCFSIRLDVKELADHRDFLLEGTKSAVGTKQ